MDPRYPQPTPAQYSPPAEGPIRESTGHDETVKELRHAIEGSHDILTKATSVFPLTLFPNTIVVDRSKLTVIRRTFIGAAEVKSMRIEDLLSVDVTMGPIFGTITATSRFYDKPKPFTVKNLKRQDALRVKRIAQGYIMALKRHIDCSSIPRPELAAMLEKLGDDRPE